MKKQTVIAFYSHIRCGGSPVLIVWVDISGEGEGIIISVTMIYCIVQLLIYLN